jgi:DNA helicase-2/ATP-dependent DNA helicase PcrA
LAGERLGTDFLAGLNPAQRDAVAHDSGPLLVLAGAGSGKTRVLTQRIAYLIAVKKVAPEHILAVTFTNKAAREMQARIKQLIGTTAKRLIVSTFHSFGVRILRRYGKQIGLDENFTICDENERLQVLRQVLSTLPPSGKKDEKWIFNRLSGAKNASLELPTYDDAPAGLPLAEIHRNYQQRLQRNNCVDFDDLLQLPMRLMHEHPDILSEMQQRFHYFLIDEYQDTNFIQYQLLKRLASARRNICVVGDDDQSIYAWRGAVHTNILEFERDWPEAKIVTLEQNYRSTPQILAAANAVIKNNDKRRAKALWSDLPQGAPLEFIAADDEQAEVEEVANHIRRLRLRQRARFADIAILFRRNIQSRPLESGLRLQGIPYHLVGGNDFFSRREIRDILAYLRLLVNPRDEMALSEALLTPGRGIGRQSIDKLRTLAQLRNEAMFTLLDAADLEREFTPGKVKALADFKALIDEIRERLNSASPLEIFDHLLAAIAYRDYLRQRAKEVREAERRLKVVDDLRVSLAAWQARVRQPSIAAYLEMLALAKREDRGDESSSGRVTLMTIHAAKGLEFPYVFVIGMEEGIFPSSRAVEEGKIDEERRLCYVAMTRAQRQLFLSACALRRRYGKEEPAAFSRFLSEIPAAAYRQAPGSEAHKEASEGRQRQAARDFYRLRKHL